MIPGLLHQRLLGVGVADPPTYDGILLQTEEQVFSSGPGEVAEATVYFIVRPNGTWEGQNNNAVSLDAGNWYSPTTNGIGAGYEVKFTVTQDLGSGVGITITNPAVGFVSLSTLKTLSIKNSQTTNGARQDAFTVVAEIKEAGGAVVATGTFTVALGAVLNSSS
jgi:hypothetical protein